MTWLFSAVEIWKTLDTLKIIVSILKFEQSSFTIV